MRRRERETQDQGKEGSKKTESEEKEKQGERECVQCVRLTTAMPLNSVFTWHHTTGLLTTDVAQLSVCVQLCACVFSVTETLTT